MNLQLNKVVLRNNSRADATDGIAELMQSMKDIGQLQDVVVRPLTGKKGKDKYELVAGFRRYNAARKLGWKSIEVKVLDDLKDQETLLVNLTENIQRIDVPQFDVGRYVSLLKKKYYMTDSEIAARLGKSISYVESALNTYNRLPDEFTDKVVVSTTSGRKKNGKIPAAHASIVLNTARRTGLSIEDKKKLLRASSNDSFNVKKITTACKLVTNGYSVERALDVASDAVSFSVTVLVSKAEANRLRNQYGRNSLPILARKILTGKIKDTINEISSK